MSYESRSWLETCLGRLVDRGHRVVVVDNASTDGSAAFARERFPTVQVLEREVNDGYGAAANAGIEAAPARFVLVLNADAWPQADDSLDTLVRFVEERDDIGVAGPLLVGPDGSPRESLVGFVSTFWIGSHAVSSTHRGLVSRLSGGVRDLLTGSGRESGGALVGAALLLRREAFEALGGFDPSYFMYYEDTDLCWRMLRAGWAVDVCPAARFVHVGGGSTSQVAGEMFREQLRSHLRFLATHRGARNARFARLLLIWTLRLKSLLRSGAQRERLWSAAGWLASASVDAHLAHDPGTARP